LERTSPRKFQSRFVASTFQPSNVSTVLGKHPVDDLVDRGGREKAVGIATVRSRRGSLGTGFQTGQLSLNLLPLDGERAR